MQIKEVIKKSNQILKDNNIEDYFFKSKILLSKLLNKSKEYLIIYQDEEVDFKIQELFFSQIELLKQNVPIQYITNEQEFMGLKFYVDENVLIPQPDTEILVEDVISKIKPNYKILDLCTGSGAIGIAVKKNRIDISVDLLDISDKALEIAKKNADNNFVNVNIIQSDLFENVCLKYNVIVSNPPYIETDVIESLSDEVRKEPKIALDGGIDGLEFYRKIAKNAKQYLEKDGILALEIGYNQKDSVIEILEKNGYKKIYSKKDYGNNDRIVVGMKGD